jgi:hypothetical protein
MRFKRPVIFASVVVAALVPVVGMTVFAWRMVGDVRRDAEVTDVRMRELAWRCLAYADAFGGFPMAEAELRGHDAPAELSVRREGYPATRVEALGASPGGASAEPPPPADLDALLESIEVEWPMARDVQPILRSRGHPTRQGTVPTIGQWLYAMTERIRGG